MSALGGEWDDLLSRSRSNTLFLTWDWISSWAAIVARRVEPLVLTARGADGRLVGVAPLYRSRFRLLRALPYRVLRIMADQASGAEYGDWIADRSCEDDALAALGRALAQRRDWDAIWMPLMASWNGADDRVARACRANGLHCRSRPAPFSFLPVAADFESYLGSLSYQRRKTFRRQISKVMRRGARVVTCRNPEELPRFLAALFDLHRRRWRLKGDPGTFDRKPTEAAFYRLIAPRALERGWLRVIAIVDQEVIKAIEIGYVYNGDYHSMQGGFDPEYEKGVGNVLRLETMRLCMNEGVRGFDLLAGYTEDKESFGATQRLGQDALILRRSPKTWPVRFAVWPSGRYLRPTAPRLDDVHGPEGTTVMTSAG